MAKYYTYNSGVEAKHLHLGNLVHDYKNPNDLEPYIEKAYTEFVSSRCLSSVLLTPDD
jgi:hypothetical protein